MAEVEGHFVAPFNAGIGNTTIRVTALRERPILCTAAATSADANGYFRFTVQSFGGSQCPVWTLQMCS